MSSNCFSKSSIVFEIFSTSIDLSALFIPLTTLPMFLLISLVRIAVSRRAATASMRLLIFK